MYSLDQLHPFIPGRRWPWQGVSHQRECQEETSRGIRDLLHWGAVTLKCCLSEDIQVVSLLP